MFEAQASITRPTDQIPCIRKMRRLRHREKMHLFVYIASAIQLESNHAPGAIYFIVSNCEMFSFPSSMDVTIVCVIKTMAEVRHHQVVVCHDLPKNTQRVGVMAARV